MSLDTFYSSYDTNVTAADTNLQLLKGAIQQIEYDEKEPGLKSSDITKFATRKEKLYKQIRTIEKEKAYAAQCHSQLPTVQNRLKSILASLAVLEKAEKDVDKPSEVTEHATKKAQLTQEKEKLVNWVKNTDKEVEKLVHF